MVRDIGYGLAMRAAFLADTDPEIASLSIQGQFAAAKSWTEEDTGSHFLICLDTGVILCLDGRRAPPVVDVYHKLLLYSGLSRPAARRHAVLAMAG